jgi:hypothetical protein
MAAGIVGVSHHYWWVGLPDIWVPIGTTFSTLEFVPLMFILYRSFGEYRSMRAQGEEFPYTLPLLFIIGSSIWNFIGGGVLGFFINLPVINYYEHGTYLTVAHAHTATFRAFGLLALGLGTYILRVVTPEADWNPTWFRGAFWLTNIGLVVMTIASLLPVGFLQLQTAYSEGYDAARSLEFYDQPHIRTLLWADARRYSDDPRGARVYRRGSSPPLCGAPRWHHDWSFSPEQLVLRAQSVIGSTRRLHTSNRPANPNARSRDDRPATDRLSTRALSHVAVSYVGTPLRVRDSPSVRSVFGHQTLPRARRPTLSRRRRLLPNRRDDSAL